MADFPFAKLRDELTDAYVERAFAEGLEWKYRDEGNQEAVALQLDAYRTASAKCRAAYDALVDYYRKTHIT